MNDNESASATGAAEWQRAWGGYGLAAIVLGYFAAPALRFMDARILLVVGLMLGLGVAAWFDAWVGDHTKRRTSIVTGALYLTVALIFGWPEISGAIRSISANDRRCLAIQSDMLAAAPRRSDDADLFQALGCRPQGPGSVHAAPPHAAGTAANH